MPLTKRLARYFDESAEDWLAHGRRHQDTASTVTSLPTEFTRIGRAADIPEGEMIIVCNNLAVVARIGGGLHAFGNVCPHAGGPIGEGLLDGCVVECPWHAGRWDVTTGKALTRLATADIPVFEVRVVDGDAEFRLSPAGGCD